jgi:2'-5' RNA ligase
VIRLFAALPLPLEIGEGLARRQDGVAEARWRRLDQLHITLRFFGEVEEVAAADLDAELAGLAAEAFELRLEGVGAFGEGADVRALWAGVAASEPLARLAARCETRARRIGLKPEARAYRPHVTLAYLRHADPVEVAAWVQGHNLLQSPPFLADRFCLYSSWRSPHGSRYDLERDYALL